MEPRFKFSSYPGNDASSREYQKYNQRLRIRFFIGFVCLSILPTGLCCQRFGRVYTSTGVAVMAFLVYLFYRLWCKVPRNKSPVELKAEEYAHRCRKWFVLVYLVIVAWPFWHYYREHDERIIAITATVTALLLYPVYRLTRRRRKDEYLDDNKE